MLLLCLEPTAWQSCFRAFYPTFSLSSCLFFLTHSLAGGFFLLRAGVSEVTAIKISGFVCALHIQGHILLRISCVSAWKSTELSFFSLSAKVRTMHPHSSKPIFFFFFFFCCQYSGTLRPGADTRSKGCRGNNRAPSPWWWIGPGRLHQVWPHDLCHRPADKSSCVETGAAQVRTDYVTMKVNVAPLEKHVSQSRTRMFDHTAHPWWNSLFCLSSWGFLTGNSWTSIKSSSLSSHPGEESWRSELLKWWRVWRKLSILSATPRGRCWLSQSSSSSAASPPSSLSSSRTGSKYHLIHWYNYTAKG